MFALLCFAHTKMVPFVFFVSCCVVLFFSCVQFVSFLINLDVTNLQLFLSLYSLCSLNFTSSTILLLYISYACVCFFLFFFFFCNKFCFNFFIRFYSSLITFLSVELGKLAQRATKKATTKIPALPLSTDDDRGDLPFGGSNRTGSASRPRCGQSSSTNGPGRGAPTGHPVPGSWCGFRRWHAA